MTTTGQSTRISADQVWAAYYHSLIQTVAGSFDPATQAVSLAGRARVTDLGNPDPAIAANYVFETGNKAPAWGPESAPPEGLLFSYAEFLDNIDFGEVADPGLRPRLEDARSKYNVANKNFADVRSHAVAAWIESRQIEPPIDFASFVKSHFPLYTLAAQALQGADSVFEALMFQAYGTNYSAIADARNKCGITMGARATDRRTPFNMAVKRCANSVITDNNVLREVVVPPFCEPLPAYAPTFKLDGFAPAYAEWQANSARGVAAETIIVTAGSSEAWQSDYPWPPGGGKSLGDFFMLGASGDTQPVNTRSYNFSLIVSFAGLNTFSIAPGGWYDPGIVEAYKNKLLPTAPPLFGDDGPMALLPTAAIVGFEPSIVLRLERSDYERFKARGRARSAASIKIGQFTIGNTSDRAFGDKTDIDYDDARSTVTVRPGKKTLPLLLGVVSTKI